MGRPLQLALFATVLWTGAAVRARPPHGDDGDAGTWAASWVPSRAEQRQRIAERRGQLLARDLQRWPGIRHASVRLAPVSAENTPLDRPLPAPTASVTLLHEPEHPPDLLAVRRTVAASVPQMDPSAVQVHSQAAPARPPAPSLSRVGPFRVASEHAPWLRATLVLALALNALLAAYVVWRLRPAARGR